jgi:flagellar biosynthetic protein FliR
MRIMGLFITSPFFSGATIPIRLRILLAFLISIIIYPVLSKEYAIVIPKSMLEYSILSGIEFLIGVFIGVLVSIIYSSFQLAGEMISMQIGFTMSNVMDPEAQIELPIIGYLKSLIGILVFLSINGHHLLLKAIFDSYSSLPLGGLKSKHIKSIFSLSINTFMEMFVIAIKIALPIIGISIIIYATLGILSRVAPQFNVFMLGFSIQIIFGFISIVILAPIIVNVMSNAFIRFFEKLFHFLSIIRGG